jgi:hypothetical protein
VNGAAYKCKGVLFSGWKIRDLSLWFSPTFNRNHYYLDLIQRVDKAIWDWHLGALAKYDAYCEKVREEDGTIIDITEDSPKKIPPIQRKVPSPSVKNVDLPIPRKVPSKTTKNVDLVSIEQSFGLTKKEANKTDAAVVNKPKAKKKTTPEDAVVVTKPKSKKKPARKHVPDRKKPSTTKVSLPKKILKENENTKNMDKQTEQGNQKSKDQ